jgi:CDP-diglyceride synthetase
MDEPVAEVTRRTPAGVQVACVLGEPRAATPAAHEPAAVVELSVVGIPPPADAPAPGGATGPAGGRTEPGIRAPGADPGTQRLPGGDPGPDGLAVTSWPHGLGASSASPRSPAPGEPPASPVAASSRRSGWKRVLTGCAAGGVALGVFLAGPLPALVLVAVVATLACGELLAALRRGAYRPAAPVVLAAVPATMVAAYAAGIAAIPAAVAAVLLACWCWFLARRSPRSTADLGVSLLGASWIGFLGAFAGALLAPGTFADRRGLAVLVAAVLLAVGNDVGAYAVGSRLGRHKLAPAVSPGKTWEGTAAGCAVTLVLAALVAARIHPLDPARALLLGAVVCLLAPLGDLAESLVKRDLGLKDMGDLLPAHGGVLDRVDSLLLVLPAAYYLAVAWHLG